MRRAGGVGLILCPWAKHIGATVIGTVGSDEKAELARAHGCDHTIVYSREDFVGRVEEITGGKGVNKVFDGVGKDTFQGSFDCLAPMGHLVSFGQSSGPVEPVTTAMLGQKIRHPVAALPVPLFRRRGGSAGHLG